MSASSTAHLAEQTLAALAEDRFREYKEEVADGQPAAG